MAALAEAPLGAFTSGIGLCSEWIPYTINQMLMMIARITGIVPLVCGLALMFPVWWPNPPTNSPAGPPGQSRAAEAPLSGWDDPRLTRLPGESDSAFFHRLTQTVYRATYHCEAEESRQSLAASLAADRVPDTAKFGYLDPSILRCGLCHQRAFILSEALKRGGVSNVRTYGLNGHVITLAGADGGYFILDPDFGIGPFPYEGSAYGAAPTAYYTSAATSDMVSQLKSGAYSTMGDDSEYMSHDWLVALAAKQVAAVREIELELTRAGAGGVALGLILILLPRRIRRSEDKPERGRRSKSPQKAKPDPIDVSAPDGPEKVS